MEMLSKKERALAALRRLRPKFRMSTRQRRRMSLLLAKGNEGQLSREEMKELDDLVEESTIRSLELAKAVVKEVNASANGQHTGRAAL
jgi:hypothetical protein